MALSHFNLHTTPLAPRVLVAPLDWGLGHATRCIPIIRLLQQQGARVWLASEGAQASLLRREFPDIPMLDLPGYRVSYSRRLLLWHLASQWGRVKKAIAHEHQWLQAQAAQHGFDIIISDNRYGMWAKGCHNVFITHQLSPAVPAMLGPIRGLVRRQLYGYMQNFHECWVPDGEGIHGISGSLGHPAHMPSIPVHYVGWLTRFQQSGAAASPHAYKLLAVLSGPEPQRSLLEALLADQLKAIQEPVILVRGLPDATDRLNLPSNIVVHQHLDAAAMQQAMQASALVLCRGGYSTLMDAFTLGKKCIVIPTPGQTEQEYLARALSRQQAVLASTQSGFSLQKLLEQAESFSFRIPSPPADTLLAHAVQRILQQHVKPQPAHS